MCGGLANSAQLKQAWRIFILIGGAQQLGKGWGWGVAGEATRLPDLIIAWLCRSEKTSGAEPLMQIKGAACPGQEGEDMSEECRRRKKG